MSQVAEQDTRSSAARLVSLNPRQRPQHVSAEPADSQSTDPMAWAFYPARTTFRFFATIRHDAGKLSAEIPALPGVYAHADTLNDAVQRLREAAAAAIESYLAEGGDIPWQQENEQAVSRENLAFEGWLEIEVHV
jgi:predicted RNase H-like HicB family nuclease